MSRLGYPIAAIHASPELKAQLSCPNSEALTPTVHVHACVQENRWKWVGAQADSQSVWLEHGARRGCCVAVAWKVVPGGHV